MIPVVFINCDDAPYIDMICNLTKPAETRSRRVLHRFIGQRVFLAETGRRCRSGPVVRCSAVIDSVFVARSYMTWDCFRRVHKVPRGSSHDWKPNTDVKYLYHLSDVQPVSPFTPSGVRHGRTWMEYTGPVPV